MKKTISILLIMLFSVSLLCLCSCKNDVDYSTYISQLRKEILFGENDNFSVLCFEETRETPFLSDGTIENCEKLMIFKICAKAQNLKVDKFIFKTDKEYSKTVNEKLTSDGSVYTVSVADFCENSLTLTVFANNSEIQQNIELFSKVNSDTISFNQAIEQAKKHNQEVFEGLKSGQKELNVRLICEGESNFWFVGIVDKESTIAYLINGKDGKVIAEKQLKTLN